MMNGMIYHSSPFASLRYYGRRANAITRLKNRNNLTRTRTTPVTKKRMTKMARWLLVFLVVAVAARCNGTAHVPTPDGDDLETCEKPSAPAHGCDDDVYDTSTTTEKVANKFSPLTLDKGVLSWIHNTEKGYYNRKQQFRHQDPNDPSTLAGIFAKERIEKGELLCRVPWEYVVTSRSQRFDDDDDEQLSCSTVRELARQMRLGKKSKFGPYIEYLKEQPENQLPSMWSNAGKALLLKVLGQTQEENSLSFDDEYHPGVVDLQVFHFPPDGALNWIESGWYGGCKGDPSDKVGRKAAMMAILRADDSLMIPAYDFYNHRNGEYHNADTTIEHGRFHETRALRDIERGEQIYISYNRCSECGGRKDGYGTAEMFRDYGFVEAFPQRWHYYNHNELEFELIHDEESGYYSVEWVIRPEDDRVEIIREWLLGQVRRLERLRHVTSPTQESEQSGVPKNEWDMIWSFHKANIVAMRSAINALDGIDRTSATDEPEVSVSDLYHELVDNSWKAVDLEVYYCNMDTFEQYHHAESVSTFLQDIDFSFSRRQHLDVCMHRNEKTAVCSSFRPAYYEYIVHPAASLVKSVRRVMVMGSGASFLVHEVMKYASTLELLVAIEVDQTVARKAFQHFYVDPHFDDLRVEWWFGDFGEILSVLPEDYWNSFDLVLIDTAKSNFRSIFLDGMGYADLVHKQGIVVSHNNHIGELSESFAFASRLAYHLKPNCIQVLTLGSHSVDFLHSTSVDHKIDSLVYEASLMEDHRLRIFHDFEHRSVNSSGSRGIAAEDEELSSSLLVGVIEMVEVVNVTKNLADTVDVIQAAVTKQGLNILSASQLTSSDSAVVVMKEGYIVARLDILHQYVGLDISLSARVSKLAALKSSLVDNLGSPVSSYHFVTNGLEQLERKSLSAEQLDDSVMQQALGSLDAPVVEVIVDEILQTKLNSLPKQGLLICENTTNCLSRDRITDLNATESLHRLFMCRNLQDQRTEASLRDAMIACEHQTREWIESTLVSKEIRVGLIVLDGGLSRRSLQILDAIFNMETEPWQSWIPGQTLLLTLPARRDTWQEHRSFRDRFHAMGREWKTPQTTDASVKAEFLVTDRDELPLAKFGVVSHGGEDTLCSIQDLEANLAQKLSQLDYKVQLIQLQGQPLETSDIPPARNFDHYEYAPSDKTPSSPIILGGAQALFQVDFVQKVSPHITVDMLSTFVGDALQVMGATTILQTHISGDNHNVVVVECEKGNVVVVLDPEHNSMDFNFFSPCHKYEACVADDLFLFVNALVRQSFELAIFSLEMFPRGTGKVMNFAPGQKGNVEEE